MTGPDGVRDAHTPFRGWMDASEARERGRTLRARIGHDDQRVVLLSPTRPSMVEYIESTNEGRLPFLTPLRVGRMLTSPFAFLRGSASLMAADLAAGPSSGLHAQLCGDAHAGNFGLYGTSDGRIVMDINDFDETAIGPWEWDLKRLATSLILAGHEGGVSRSGRRDAVEDTVRSYRKTIEQLSELPFVESWTALGDESVLTRVKAHELLDDFADATRKARKNTSAKVAAKWARKEGTDWRFTTDPPLQTPVDPDTAEALIEALPAYARSLRESRAHLLARFQVSDVTFRVAGTGSVGLRNYLILLKGNQDEVLVLQAKQARRSALADQVTDVWAGHEGERIVHGARLVQAETDLFLGWTSVEDRPFIVRQFRNQSADIDVTTLEGGHLDDYGRLAGALLARAHTRSVDPRILAAYCEHGRRMDAAFADFAETYAERVEADHAELLDAVARGRIEAVTEG